MYDLIDITFDARRAEMEYRTAKLAATRRVRLTGHRRWHRTGTVSPTSTTD